MGTKHKPHKSLTVVSPHTHIHTGAHTLKLQADRTLCALSSTSLLLLLQKFRFFEFRFGFCFCFSTSVSVSVSLVVLVFRTVISFSFRFGLKLCLMICYCCCFFLRNLPLLYAQIFSLFCFLFFILFALQISGTRVYVVYYYS